MPAAEKTDLTNQLLARFKGMIAERVLRPGVKLPPERELARKFGVSRSSLRHALKVLDIMGVLTQRVGDGTYLTTSAARILSEPLEFLVLLDGISLFDLVETRLIVEPELAARAAQRATSQDLEALRASLEGMAKERTHEKLVACDLAFHEAIFRASGNLMCQRLFTWIHEAMLTSVSLTSQMVDWKHTLSYHRPIFTAIERRRPDDARRYMFEHLSDARQLITRIGTRPERLQLPEDIAPIRKNTRRRREA
jgi:GntR family transcriptional regulator, transcriptional repressor for pyruvate dehydrogenase complex